MANDIERRALQTREQRVNEVKQEIEADKERKRKEEEQKQGNAL